MLSVIYVECRYAECHYTECRYADCRYAECHGAVSTAESFTSGANYGTPFLR
jgi:hypothetical protein